MLAPLRKIKPLGPRASYVLGAGASSIERMSPYPISNSSTKIVRSTKSRSIP
jgi:hypothetical protein